MKFLIYRIILSRLDSMVVHCTKILNLVNSNPSTYVLRQRMMVMHFMLIAQSKRISTPFTKTVCPFWTHIGSHLWFTRGRTQRWRHHERLFSFFYQITQMDSMLLWVCTVIDHMTLHRLWRHLWSVTMSSEIWSKMYLMCNFISTRVGSNAHLNFSNRNYSNYWDFSW